WRSRHLIFTFGAGANISSPSSIFFRFNYFTPGTQQLAIYRPLERSFARPRERIVRHNLKYLWLGEFAPAPVRPENPVVCRDFRVAREKQDVASSLAARPKRCIGRGVLLLNVAIKRVAWFPRLVTKILGYSLL